MTLTEFLLARIAEQEAWLRGGGSFVEECQECAFGQQPQSPYSLVRMFAECEAKRRILDQHEAVEGYCASCEYVKSPCNTLRLLAFPYANHPDYQEEWRP